MRPNTPVIALKGFASRETELAILFEVTQIGEGDSAAPVEPSIKTWFPFSQVARRVSQPKNSQELDTLVVSQWIAEQKGIA